MQAGTLPAGARLFLAVGILGGYTTFSYETLQLLDGGSPGPFLFNAFGQILVGLVAVYLGVVCGRAVGGT